MTSQYLHPDYPNSMPTAELTLSPLVLLAQTCDSIGKEVAPFNQKLSTKLVQSSCSSSSTSPFSPSSTSSQSLISKVTSTTQHKHHAKSSVEKTDLRALSNAQSSNGDDDNDDEYNKNEITNDKSKLSKKFSRDGDSSVVEDRKTDKVTDGFVSLKKKTNPVTRTLENGTNHPTNHHEGEVGMKKNGEKNSKRVKEENVLVDVVGATSPESWLTREAKQAGSKHINFKSKSKSIRSPHATAFIPSHPSKRFKKTLSDMPSNSINVKQTVHGNTSRKIDLRSDKGVYSKDYYGSANSNSLKKSNNLWFNTQQPYHATPNYFDLFNSSNPLLNHPMSHYPSEYEALMKQHSHQASSSLPSLPPSNPFMDYYMASLYDYMLKMHLSMGNHQHPGTFPPSPQSLPATPEFDFNLKSLTNSSNLILIDKVKGSSSEDKRTDRSMENAEKRLPYNTHPWMNPFMLSQSLKNNSNPSYLQLLSLSSQQQLQQQLQQQFQHRHNNTPFQHLLLCPFHLHPINEACSKSFSNTDDLLEHVKTHWPSENSNINNDISTNYNNLSHTINHKGVNNGIFNKSNEFEKMKFEFSNQKSNNDLQASLQAHHPFHPSLPHPFMSSLFNSFFNENKNAEASVGLSPNSDKSHCLFKRHLSNNVP